MSKQLNVDVIKESGHLLCLVFFGNVSNHVTLNLQVRFPWKSHSQVDSRSFVPFFSCGCQRYLIAYVVTPAWWFIVGDFAKARVVFGKAVVRGSNNVTRELLILFSRSALMISKPHFQSSFTHLVRLPD